MNKKILTIIFILCSYFVVKAQSNHVFTSGEAVNFGIIDLATPSSQSWSTDRLSMPGYFAAFGTASYTSATDVANVNGYVKHYANTANQGFTFPVGTGTDLRSLSTSGTIANNSQFATGWILGNPTTTIDPTDGTTHSTTSVAGDVLGVNIIGQWDWQDISGTGSGVTITVSIPDVSAFALASQLRLVGWNGTQWVNLSVSQGITAASGNIENSTLSGTMQSGITAIGIGKGYNTVYVKVFLQGAMSGTNTMTNYLTTSSFVPSAQPFNNTYFGYTGTETNTTLSTSATVTDWVMVELRNTVTGATSEMVPAFIKTDGNLIDGKTGLTGVQFSNAIPGNYYVIVHHRNHLSIVSPTAIILPNTSATKHDFTTGLSQALDNGSGNSMKQTSTGVWAMWYGDYNHDQIIDNLDQNLLNQEFLTGPIDGYFIGDLNFDGFVDNLDLGMYFLVNSVGLNSPLY